MLQVSASYLSAACESQRPPRACMLLSLAADTGMGCVTAAALRLPFACGGSCRAGSWFVWPPLRLRRLRARCVPLPPRHTPPTGALLPTRRGNSPRARVLVRHLSALESLKGGPACVKEARARARFPRVRATRRAVAAPHLPARRCHRRRRAVRPPWRECRGAGRQACRRARPTALDGRAAGQMKSAGAGQSSRARWETKPRGARRINDPTDRD